MNTKTSNSTAVMNTYGRFPIVLVKGKGACVTAEDGSEYLDFTSGIATCNLGHCPEIITDALHKQLDTLWHVSNLYHIPVQQQLAEILTENTHFQQVFFCNSGAEANEAAIKLVKKYWSDQKAIERNTIITFSHSFHGRTGTTMAATAQEKIHQGFAPLTPGFQYANYNDPQALNMINTDSTAAVMLELIQGEGGVIPAETEWVKLLCEECQRQGIPVLIDEVQSGIGRTGTFYAYEQFDIQPDIITSAKGLGSGFPIGAMLASEKFSRHFTPGTHGSTFGGNPLAATAALETVKIVKNESFLQSVKEQSDWFVNKLEQMASSFNLIEEVRGKGFLIGIQLKIDAITVIKALHDKEILTLPAGPNVLRILPPLNVRNDQLVHFANKLQEVLTEIQHNKEDENHE
ncbi:acetylornithine transaminase [Salisediminibacterium beveridgei]|uniref:Acetylornithine aminotransferase n=1 Tax=Salisediminibacterium beveridgei TaxID=632773 RepID=A0A1D7QVH4_9BACI|nr:acetylornithine transaminase [Salisediminibacterium beveridgei]AOM82979.1 Acetylornithine aminotransferase [Salisediminibacterium beveridgei]